MPNPNAFVGTIARVDRDVEGGPALELEDGRRARIDPRDRRAGGFVEILEELRERGKAAYLEVDPQTGFISRLRIPRAAHVIGITAAPSGDLVFEIPYSQGGHLLRRDSPDFDNWAGLLREALDRRLPVLLTEDDRHELIDLRWYPNPDERLPFPRPGLPPEWWRWWPWKWFVDIYRLIFKVLGWWLAAVAPARANELFNLCAARRRATR